MSRKFYLFDASAATQYYIAFRNSRTEALLTTLLKYKQDGNAFFYIPIFCITEIFNTIAKHRYRYGTLEKAPFEAATEKVRDHMRARKVFYPYALDRHHNYNCDQIFNTEHTTDTEYQASGLPPGTSAGEINMALAANNQHDHIGKHYLATFDILIIGMGIELRRIHGNSNVAIVTDDRRLASITNALGSGCRPPDVIALGSTTMDELKKFQAS